MNPMKLALILAVNLLSNLLAAAAEPKGNLKELMKSATWEFYNNPKATVPFAEFRFLDGGQIECAHPNFLSTWDHLGGNKVKIVRTDGLYWVFDYRAAGRQATVVKYKDGLEDNNTIRVKR